MKLLFRLTTAVAFANAAATMAAAVDAPLYATRHAEGREWVSLRRGLEFQPAADTTLQRRLASGYHDQFADSAETIYDPYATAWRLLGFYIDCEHLTEDGRRRLEEAQQEEEEEYNGSCKRYLLWAAYVDLDYQGGGIGEYQIYDAQTKEWDKTACTLHGNGRCAKMDCHLSTSHYKLLGFYKDSNYLEWMGQLFKHAGYCTWSENQYNFMENYLDWWPEGCTATNYEMDDGSTLYYDIKPSKNGAMALGLYTDAKCSRDFTGELSIVTVLNNGNENDNDGVDWDTLQSTWNAALDTYRACQPCKAFDIGNNPYEEEEQEQAQEEEPDEQDGGERQRRQQRQRKLQDEDAQDQQDEYDGDPNQGYFQCDDAAGATNVNQCMKLATQTGTMMRASFQDMVIAQQQGMIQNTRATGVTTSSTEWWSRWGMLTMALVVFALGVTFLTTMLLTRRKTLQKYSEPLVTTR